VGAKHGEFVTDEICDRFCVLGTPDQAAEKLKELESIGVDQFDLYLMTEGQKRELEVYGTEIIPRFAGVTAERDILRPLAARGTLDPWIRISSRATS
jgi:alkanesulfonate monooxygenase SsuD/methylene tetrahydromethanopterin reductase-like flavin-dependent oxidoreductase (luciferase family)